MDVFISIVLYIYLLLYSLIIIVHLNFGKYNITTYFVVLVFISRNLYYIKGKISALHSKKI